MATYSVQAAYKDTDDDLTLTAKMFEAENEYEASLKAVAYFTGQHSFRDQYEFLFSTPKKVESIQDGPRETSIKVSTSGTPIVDYV